MEKEKLIIHKNKGETFRCQFNIDGADNKSAIVRLCLEFSDHKNMFFTGSISEQGECVINVPPLRELENKKGDLYIEAIADSTYFKVYEAEVELKNSVDVKLIKTESTAKNETVRETKLTLEGIKIDRKTTPTEPEQVPMEEAVKEEPVHNPFVVANPKKPVEKPKSKFSSFADFKGKNN